MNKTKKVCVIGLGYVGLPLACLCANKGYLTYGLDTNESIVEKTNKKISHIEDSELKKDIEQTGDNLIATTSPKIIKECDIIFICVPTPIDKNFHPDLKYVKAASETVSKHIKKGHIIILESTVFPGTTEEVCLPILEQFGCKAGNDFILAYCPERIDPGNKKWTVKNIPRVVGVIPNEKTDVVADFYRSIIDAKILELGSVKSAEATKIMENTFRDINIAFVNELAMSFDNLGIDITEVIRGASTKPFSFMPHYPGCGVGGHCIPVDPYYLIERAKESGFSHNFLSLAREINNNMPKYTIQRLEQAVREIGKKITEVKISLLGLAYKGGVDDDRESPAYKILDELKKLNANVNSFDPHLLDKSDLKTINAALESEVIIIATDHPEFKILKPKDLADKGIKIIIDGKNIFNPEEVKSVGIIYKGIGRS